MLSLSGLDKKYFNIQDIDIGDDIKIHTIYINRIKETEHNKLLMIHGYGGNSAIFYKMLKDLSKFFYITLVDIPGMGFCSRNERIKLLSSDMQYIDFYVDCIEKVVQ